MCNFAWKKAGWTEPVLENDFELQEVQLTLFIPKVDVAENVAHKLTERQADICELIKENVAEDVTVNTKYLSEKLGFNRKTIQRDLAVLQDNGMVEWYGSDKDGHWEIRSSK